MATMVERPMSVSSDALAVHQQRPSIEIIDVDLLDDHSASSPQGPTPAARPQPETIMIIDIDEEDNGPSQALAAARRQRLISPPPPTPSGSSRIPPVPRVPRHYSALTSLPRPHRNPVPSPPVIRPIDQPFDFEALHEPPPPVGSATAHLHPNRHRRIHAPEIHAEPRSHHTPALGLGGALISLNRAQANARLQRRLQREAQIRDHAAAVAPGILGRAVNRVFSFLSRSAFTDDEDEDMHVQGLLADDLGFRFDHPARAFAVREVLLRHRERQMEYKPEFTHPGKPDPGYVFDFGPPEPSLTVEPNPPPIVIDIDTSDDETPGAGPSTKKVPDPPSPKPSTLLVCARCLDPLVLGARLVGEEEKKRRVWGLRCGHLIDGKCLDLVGVPTPQDDLEVADEEIEVEPEEPPLLRSRTHHRAKGKARAVEESAMTAMDDNPMRSRLRSRGSVPIPPPPVALPPPANARPSPSSVLGKRKRTTRSRVGQTYEWKCPVASCGHLHASVQVDGAWVPEPAQKPPNFKGKGKVRSVLETDGTMTGRGAIPVFV